MSKIIHFEIPADDPARAIKFYKDVFGWKIDKWDAPVDYWLVTAGEDGEPGINGAIMPREGENKIRDTISVESYDKFAKKIESEGGKMLTEKMTIPGMGFNGLFQDTEGNVMGIIEVTMLYITRIFNASPEKVWEAWTDPESIKEWWGPKDFTAPSVKNNLTVGGTYLYDMKSPEGQDFWSTGVYREIVHNEKIVATDSFSDEDGNVVNASYYGMKGDWPLELEVTVTFKEEDGKTRLTIQHAGFPDRENTDLAESGWNESLDKLAEYLEKAK